jgi:hypothetical protein
VLKVDRLLLNPKDEDQRRDRANPRAVSIGAESGFPRGVREQSLAG